MAYQANAVDFDGTNDYLTRGADLTGNSDGKVGTISFWWRLDANQTASIINSDLNRVFVTLFSSSVWQIKARNTGGVDLLDLRSASSYTSSVNWHHFIASWDLTDAAKAFLFIDGLDDTNSSRHTDGIIDYTQPDWGICARATDDPGDQKWNGCIADLWFDPTTFIDISVEANIQKFRDASGNVVDLGNDGSIPTGTAPLIFLSGPTVDWHTNLGSGGGFTENGALTDCSTDPPAAPAGTTIAIPVGTMSTTGQVVSINEIFNITTASSITTNPKPLVVNEEVIVALGSSSIIITGRKLEIFSKGSSGPQFLTSIGRLMRK